MKRGERYRVAHPSLRLAHFFGNSPQFWLGLQSDYDLDVASDRLGQRIDREIKTYATVIEGSG